MSYPPAPRRVIDPGAALALIESHPFAHLFTAGTCLNVTRLPFVADCEGGRAVRLRGHLNGMNPQASELDGAPVLVSFSGASTYVSPHWRSEPTRAGTYGTYDYEEVQVRGTARLVAGIAFFVDLINDLSALIEPQYAEIGGYPVWRTSMAPDGYIDRLFPHITAFEIDIESVWTISKLHQHFPVEDRTSIVEHLSRSHREDARAIAQKMRALPRS